MDADVMNAPASKSQYKVSVPAWGTDYWAGHSGGEVTAEPQEVWNGGALQPDYIAGRSKTGNITLSKPYYPGLDGERMRDWMRRVGSLRTSITIEETDADLVSGVYGRPMVYPNALLVSVTPPESEAGASDSAVLEIEFAVPGLAP